MPRRSATRSSRDMIESARPFFAAASLVLGATVAHDAPAIGPGGGDPIDPSPAVVPRRSLRGAIVDAEGIAAGHAEVRLLSIDAAGKRVVATTRSEASGRFVLELPEWQPDDARWGTLEIAAPGHARLWIDAVRVPVVGFADVGCLEVLRPVPVVGRVVDAEGRAVAGAAIALSPDRSDERGTVHDFGTAETTADADGAFEIRDLGLGSYFLRATAPGFERRGAHLRVLSEEEPARVEIVLARRPPLALEVVDSDGRPVEGALVRVAHASLVPDHPRDRFLRWLGARSTTDAAGRAVRDDVAPGDWISVRKEGIREEPVAVEESDFARGALRRVVLEPAGDREERVPPTDRAAGVLLVRYHWSDGSPLANGVVSALSRRHGPVSCLAGVEPSLGAPFAAEEPIGGSRTTGRRTDGDGLLREVAARSIRGKVEVAAAGRSGEAFSIDERWVEIARIEGALRCTVPIPGAIAGRVVWSDPAFAEPLVVVAGRRGDVSCEVPPVFCALDGTFLLRGLPPGTYDVAATRPERLGSCVRSLETPHVSPAMPRIGQRSVEVASGSTATVELLADEPSRRGSLRARIVDETGAPVDAVRARLSPLDALGMPEALESDLVLRDGRLDQRGLPPGRYVLQVWDPSGRHRFSFLQDIVVAARRTTLLGDVVVARTSVIRVRWAPELRGALEFENLDPLSPGASPTESLFPIEGPRRSRLAIRDYRSWVGSVRARIEPLGAIAPSADVSRAPAMDGLGIVWTVEVSIPAEPVEVTVTVDARSRQR